MLDGCESCAGCWSPYMYLPWMSCDIIKPARFDTQEPQFIPLKTTSVYSSVSLHDMWAPCMHTARFFLLDELMIRLLE